MPVIGRIIPGERGRFALLAPLLFVNYMVVESLEVVGTSGFASRVGVDGIVWVWAADMVILLFTAGTYSLFVDRTKRDILALRLFGGLSAVYVVLYLSFSLDLPEWLSYPILMVVNDQQWMLLPMLLWALANDLFSVSEAKRLFPLLAMVGFMGGVFGNMVTAGAARWVARSERGSLGLLLLNAGLMLLMMVVILVYGRRKIEVVARQSRSNEKVLDTLREGIAFVREVPAFRYLSLSMVLLGVGLNVAEYQMIVTAAQSYSNTASLEGFYATARAVRILLMLLMQGVAAGWLLKHIGLKSVFAMMPVATAVGLLVAFAMPVLPGAVLGQYMSRVTLEGVEEPSRRAFVGLVPDERRGRVGAFLDGYLYPVGSILSCLMVGVVVLAVGRSLLSPEVGRALYFGVAAACAIAALWFISRFRLSYDSSMLNWRLKRRRRGSALAGLDL